MGLQARFRADNPVAGIRLNSCSRRFLQSASNSCLRRTTSRQRAARANEILLRRKRTPGPRADARVQRTDGLGRRLAGIWGASPALPPGTAIRIRPPVSDQAEPFLPIRGACGHLGQAQPRRFRSRRLCRSRAETLNHVPALIALGHDSLSLRLVPRHEST